MVKICVYVDTGFANSRHEDEIEIPDEEWEAMTEEQKDKRLDEEAREFMGNCIDYAAYVK